MFRCATAERSATHIVVFSRKRHVLPSSIRRVRAHIGRASVFLARDARALGGRRRDGSAAVGGQHAFDGRGLALLCHVSVGVVMVGRQDAQRAEAAETRDVTSRSVTLSSNSLFLCTNIRAEAEMCMGRLWIASLPEWNMLTTRNLKPTPLFRPDFYLTSCDWIWHRTLLPFSSNDGIITCFQVTSFRANARLAVRAVASAFPPATVTRTAAFVRTLVTRNVSGRLCRD